jgi:hemerythrin-like domain-containing protein
MTFTEYLGSDHLRCDTLFAAAEQAVSEQSPTARQAHQAFVDAVEHHFAMEEEILFPAFENASGSEMGPTTVMRHEHGQMRQLFAQMDEAIQSGQWDDYLGAGETLLILMQQHNAKEEQMLYPMSERMLADAQQQLLQQMQAL